MKMKHTPAPVDDLDQQKQQYALVAPILRELYGYPQWRQHLEPVDELVSCILSQSTTDSNRDRAFYALKDRYPTWEAVRDAAVEDIIATVRSAGLAQQKAPRIKSALQQIDAERGAIELDFLATMPLEAARAWLLKLDGVGPKTAAIVLCFAFNLPAFPVDTHVHRVTKRLGLIPEKLSADKAHPLLEAIVPPEDYYAFHLNLIQHGREICHARRPACDRCPLQNSCLYYREISSL